MSEYTKSIEEILVELSVSEKKGLSGSTIPALQKEYGKNISYLSKPKVPLLVFISQFSTPLIVVLLLISVISIFAGQVVDGSIIMAMLLVNAFVGTFQELRAEKSLRKLSALITSQVRVLRDEKLVIVPESELVPGDIVHLKSGEVVPADIRILTDHSLSADESILTGESLPVQKECARIDKGTQPHQLKGSLFMGTAVVGGYGTGVVIATGKETYLGKTVDSREFIGSQTKFEKNLREFSDNLFRFVLIFSGVTALVNIFLGRDVITSAMLGVTLALGITPEILPVVTTIAMSHGAFALAKKKVIIRRLSALEDLGNIDMLCTDKTGTLTTGKISVTDSLDGFGNSSRDILTTAYLCSASFPQLLDKLTENPLDKAISLSLTKEEKNVENAAKIVDVSDFDFVAKRMISIVELDGKRILIRKGATEMLLNYCEYIVKNGKKIKFTESIKKEVKERISEYESRGMRIISVASEAVSPRTYRIAESKEMTYQGFIVLEDPPRFGVANDLADLKKQFISTKIITGDSANVTLRIAGMVGLEVAESAMVSGEELAAMTEVQFNKAVLEKEYFVRTTPEQKLHIIQGLRAQGHTVAYMGDGINDVGAIQAADVGISVDSASPVTKDVSDVILLEKDLSALSIAVTQGRITFTNTLKFILNTMSSSFGNVITAAVASFFLPFIPLLPKQLLLIDSLSDMQHLAFATDNVDKTQIKAPKVWNNRFLIAFILIFGLLSTVFDFLHIGIFSAIAKEAALFRTLWFMESVLTEMLATFAVRTQGSMFKSKPSGMLFITTVFAMAMAIALPAIPVLSGWLGFTPLTFVQYCVVFAVVVSYITVLELVKRWFYKTSKEKS